MGIIQNGTSTTSSNPRNRSRSSSTPNPLTGQEKLQDLQEGREPAGQQGTQEALQVSREEKEENLCSTKEEKILQEGRKETKGVKEVRQEDLPKEEEEVVEEEEGEEVLQEKEESQEGEEEQEEVRFQEEESSQEENEEGVLNNNKKIA